MAADPLNPSLPTGVSQTNVAEELRAIKGVLVQHEESLDDLFEYNQLLGTPGATGINLLRTATPAQALNVLEIGNAGDVLFHAETQADVIEFLDLSDVAPAITAQEQLGRTFTYTKFKGGFTILVMLGPISSSGTTVAFPTPFTAVFGASVSMAGGTSQVADYDELTTESIHIDQGGSSTTSVCAVIYGTM